MTATACAQVSGSGTMRLPSMLRSPVLVLTLAALFWAGSFVVGRALRYDVDPVALTFLRWLISLFVFAPFVCREITSHAHVVVREWRLIIGLGATGIALFHPLVYLALQHTSATNALLTFSLSPVVILLGAGLTNRKRPTAWEAAGVLLSMVGAAILITRGNLSVVRSMGLNAGDLWMLAAVVVWAGYSLLLRRRPADLPQMVTLVSSIVVALPMLLPFALIAAAGNPFHLSVAVLLGIFYIAVFGSVIGFLFWSHGVSKLGAARAGQFVHLMPVFGAALSFVFLGEPLSLPQLFGAGFVLAGILLIETRRVACGTMPALSIRSRPLRRPFERGLVRTSKRAVPIAMPTIRERVP
jgi:drug/metabolite transporter (DMT)-like permease